MKVLQRVFRGSSKIYRFFKSVRQTSLLDNSRLCKSLSYYVAQRVTVHSRKLCGHAKSKPIQNKNCKCRFRWRYSNPESIPFEMLRLAQLPLNHGNKQGSRKSITLLTNLCSELSALISTPLSDRLVLNLALTASTLTDVKMFL